MRFFRTICLYLLCGALVPLSAGTVENVATAAHVGNAIIATLDCTDSLGAMGPAIRLLQPILDGTSKICDHRLGVRERKSLMANLTADLYDLLRREDKQKSVAQKSASSSDLKRLSVIFGNLTCAMLLTHNIGGEKFRPFLQIGQAVLSFAQAVYQAKKQIHYTRVMALLTDVGSGIFKIERQFRAYAGQKAPCKTDCCNGCQLPFGTANTAKMLGCDHWFCESCVKNEGREVVENIPYDSGDWTNRNVGHIKMKCPCCYDQTSRPCAFMGQALDPTSETEPVQNASCSICCGNFGTDKIRVEVESYCGTCRGDDKVICHTCLDQLTQCPSCRGVINQN